MTAEKKRERKMIVEGVLEHTHAALFSMQDQTLQLRVKLTLNDHAVVVATMTGC